MIGSILLSFLIAISYGTATFPTQSNQLYQIYIDNSFSGVSSGNSTNPYPDLNTALSQTLNWTDNSIINSSVVFYLNPTSSPYTLSNAENFIGSPDSNITFTSLVQTNLISKDSCQSLPLIQITAPPDYYWLQFSQFDTITFDQISFSLTTFSNAIYISASLITLQNSCVSLIANEDPTNNYVFIAMDPEPSAITNFQLSNTFITYDGSFYKTCQTNANNYYTVCANQLNQALFTQLSSTGTTLAGLTSPSIVLSNLTIQCLNNIYFNLLWAGTVNNLNINQVQTMCFSSIEVQEANYTTITDLSIFNNTNVTSVYEQAMSNFISVTVEQGFTLTNFAIHDFYLLLLYDYFVTDLPYTAVPINIIEVYDNNNNSTQASMISLTNITVYNNHLKASPSLYGSIISITGSATTMNPVVIQSVNLTANRASKVESLFTIVLDNYFNASITNVLFQQNLKFWIVQLNQQIPNPNFQSLTISIDSVVVDNNTIGFGFKSSSNNSIMIPTSGLIACSLNYNNTNVQISNVFISNNSISISLIISIDNLMVNYQYMQNYFSLTNFQFVNNNVTSTQVIEAQGFHVGAFGFNITNNTLYESSLISMDFLTNGLQSFYLLNSTISNNSFSSSTLIQKLIYYNSIFLNLQSIFYQFGQVVLPFWIYVANNNFDQLILDSGSTLIEAVGLPFMFFTNNNFTNSLIQDNSNMISDTGFISDIADIISSPNITQYSGFFDFNTSSAVLTSSITLPYMSENGGFIHRIWGNNFVNIVSIDTSNIGDFESGYSNFTYVSFDGNLVQNVNIVTYFDSFIYFTEVYSVGMGFNTFQEMQGNGYILQIEYYNNLTITKNNFINSNGSSFATVTSDEANYTEISNNYLYNVTSNYTLISVAITYNWGPIQFINNNITQSAIFAYQSTYLQVNFVNLQVSASLGNTGNQILNVINNTCLQLTFSKIHKKIKQFQNSLFVLSVPDNTINIANCYFYNASVFYDSNFMAVYATNLNVENTTYMRINNYQLWGSLYILATNVSITSSFFFYNFATQGYGGAIYLDSDSNSDEEINIFLWNTTFRNNFALMGSSFYHTGQVLNMVAQNDTTIRGHFTAEDLDYPTVPLPPNSGSFHIENCQLGQTVFDNYQIIMQNNTVKFWYFENIIAVDPINITNVTCILQDDIITLAIVNNASDVNFIFQNISVIGSSNQEAVIFLDADSGNFQIDNLSISELFVSEPLLYLTCTGSDIQLNITNSLFDSFITPILNQSVGIIDIDIAGPSKTCDFNLAVDNVTFSNMETVADQGPYDFTSILVNYLGNINITVNNSEFSNIVNGNRGAGMVLNNTYSSLLNPMWPGAVFNNYITIENSNFTNNIVQYDGGAIWNSFNNITIINCTFINNAANLGTGGAIYTINLKNSASLIADNFYLNNTRYTGYSNVTDSFAIGSFPSALTMLPVPFDPNIGAIFTGTRNISNASTTTIESMAFNMYLVDSLNQTMYEPVFPSNATYQSKYITIIAENQTAFASNCDLQYCNVTQAQIILSGEAGDVVAVEFEYQSNYYTVPNLTLYYTLRPCLVGEINTTLIDSYACNLCPPGQYSLDLSDSVCTDCPTGLATCLGGAYLNVTPGNWRNSTSSAVILPCRDTDACLGGYNSTCYPGFTGTLCDSCDASLGYAREGVGKCGVCPSDAALSVLESLVLFAATIAYQMWFINTTYQSNKAFVTKKEKTREIEQKISQGIYVRLLTTYSQIVSVISTFNLGLQFSSSAGSAAQLVGNPTSTVFYSLQCAMIHFGFDPSYILYYQLGFTLIAPVLKLVIILGIKATHWKGHFKESRKNQILVAITCIILMEQPGVFSVLVNFLTCIELDNNYYLVADYGYECYTSEYNLFTNAIVVPSILLWGFIIPVFYFIILRRNRNHLTISKMRITVGAIYNEYDIKVYYWGIVQMVMKLMLMFITAIAYNDVKTNALSVFIVLYIYYYLYMRLQPYDKPELHKTELQALTAYLVTIFFSIYYKSAPLLPQVISVIIIALVNLIVITNLIYNIIKLNLENIKSTVSQIRGKLRRLLGRSDVEPMAEGLRDQDVSVSGDTSRTTTLGEQEKAIELANKKVVS